MNQSMKPAILGVAVAVAITTAMDGTGYTMFSELPLFPLASLFWYLQKISPRDIGLIWGRVQIYILAVAYSVTVLGLMGVIVWKFGAVDTSNGGWNKAFLNIALMSSTGLIMVLITEGGFFRGWLWAAPSRRDGIRRRRNQELIN